MQITATSSEVPKAISVLGQFEGTDMTVFEKAVAGIKGTFDFEIPVTVGGTISSLEISGHITADPQPK